jgi:hypothetical protein
MPWSGGRYYGASTPPTRWHGKHSRSSGPSSDSAPGGDDSNQLEVLRLLIRIASNEAHPENAFELARLRAGVQLVMQLQRRGRHAVRR